MNYLIAVRHGQSVWNLKKRFTGWVDVDLTEQGKIEAKKCGELIEEHNLNIPFNLNPPTPLKFFFFFLFKYFFLI